nr:hypothetical protein [Tanacetum cinerariifolium]
MLIFLPNVQGNPQQDLQDKGVFDSGCSRHMTWNMSYLTYYEEIDGGYVTFGGNPKGGKITGSGTFKTDKLDFENLYFVKELKFNLFSVSQMCDKKNSVLFNDTKYIVLSPNIKLFESRVLLKVLRKNNMYSVDLKNTVPKGDLTCLFAKATSAERRNKTLIEAARTMLADSKLPTIFWAEAVNTACYVQNRVLVVKPHNKTPYEIFHGSTPALSFMRPFGFPVTILNTKDHLDKFDEENLHIRPVVARNQSNGNAGTKACDDADDGFQPLSDDGKKIDEDPRQESECKDQEKEDNVNNTNNVNASGTNEVNVFSANTNNELLFDHEMPALEDISTFNFSSDHEDDDKEDEMNNLDTSIQVSPTPTTRIHKDHPIEQVIGDLHSTTQTKNMSKNLEEYGFVTTIYQRTNHKDLQNYLFACFLSQEEPKKTFVDLPYGKRAIGTKWVFQNKKDERGIVIRNKARLVAQGHTQEEGIDYDAVFVLVARIKAIRLILAYASFKDFIVYRMDVKSTFLNGKIEEDVYVCQPLRFEDPNFPDKVLKIDKTLFIRRHKDDILLVQVYVDDIIFGLQVRQKKDRIFLSQDKYVAEILKKYGFSKVKNASTPIKTQKPLLKDEDGEEVDVHMYRSMNGSLMYLTS